jgi:carbonic anhydrase
VVAELREDASPILLAPQAAGALMVVGAYYQLTSGEVDFFDLP